MKSTCRDFWKMVYERECGVIVMLSNLTENGEVGSMLYRSIAGQMLSAAGVVSPVLVQPSR